MQPNGRLPTCLASVPVDGIEYDVAAVTNMMKPFFLVSRCVHTWALPCWVMLSILIVVPSVTAQVTEKNIELTRNQSVVVKIHPATGSQLLLWFPSEYGFVDETNNLANKLTALGIEVWRADLLAAHFLPPLPSSIHQVPIADIAVVINQAVSDKGKTVTVFADGRGAVLALRGVKYWQQVVKNSHPRSLTGAVLLSPSLYVETPPPGRAARYLPIVGQSTINSIILQPQMSPWFWWRDRLQARLKQRGSSCEVRVLNGVRDRYYFRADATAVEIKKATELPILIQQSILRLERIQEVK